MKKIFKNPIFMFILGSIIFCGIGVFASEILSSSVKYKGKTVEDSLDELYELSGVTFPESETFSNYIINGTRETNNIISLNSLDSGEYICSSYYAASSYETSSDRGNSTSVAYEITGCNIKNEYNVNGHWNAAYDYVTSGVYTSVMSRDNSFYCKITNDNTNISVNYKPSSRTDKCSVSLYLSCTKIK